MPQRSENEHNKFVNFGHGFCKQIPHFTRQGAIQDSKGVQTEFRRYFICIYIHFIQVEYDTALAQENTPPKPWSDLILDCEAHVDVSHCKARDMALNLCGCLTL